MLIQLPFDIAEMIRRCDQLGFDVHEDAVTSILQHADFIDRWDLAHDLTPEEIARFEQWQHEVAKELHVKQLVVSMFDQWYDNKLSGLASFDVSLFRLFLAADNSNKDALIKAFPLHFKYLQFK